ncbi:MAG: glycosyltransferase family 2 protein, partial [Candidatus Sulfotelmatobacter sp.]
MNLSVVIITHNEEANLGRTLQSVQPLVRDGEGEIIIVDSGSTDRTAEIAKSFGAKVFMEEWKGYPAQKNSAIEKATGDWILSLDADEELERDLTTLVAHVVSRRPPDPKQELLAAMNVTMPRAEVSGYWIQRRNKFLGRWIRHGGFWPDPKLRLFRRGAGWFE